MFLGLHSSFIHFVSRLGYSWLVLSSVVYLWNLSEMRMPTPPPFFPSLFFPIHLYPLILIISFPGSMVSVIRAISMFSDCRRDPRLFIFPLIPFILMAAIDSDLFFLILLLFSRGLVLVSCCLSHSLWVIGCWAAVSWFVVRLLVVVGGCS